MTRINAETSVSPLQQKLLHISIVRYDTPTAVLSGAITSAVTSFQRLKVCGADAGVTLSIVDNATSNSLSPEDLSPLQPHMRAARCDLRLIQGHGNEGYGRGHNLAFYSSRARYHLFMNPDVEVDPNALDTGISYLEANPDVVVVSPLATGGDGSKQYLCKRYPTVLDLYLRGLKSLTSLKFMRERLSRYELQELSDSKPTKNVPIVSGCFMLCKTSAISSIGGFDPSYFLYFEDFDLSVRARREGSLAYVPNMRIKHLGGDAARKGIKHIIYFCQSGIRFFNSHGWKWI